LFLALDPAGGCFDDFWWTGHVHLSGNTVQSGRIYYGDDCIIPQVSEGRNKSYYINLNFDL